MPMRLITIIAVIGVVAAPLHVQVQGVDQMDKERQIGNRISHLRSQERL